MPRKGKVIVQDDDEDSEGAIRNIYLEMPKEMLLEAPNPNYKKHYFKIPFYGLVVAPSGAGKTNFVYNIIHRFSSGREGTFNSINIITKNKDEPLYNYLTKKCPDIVIKEGLHNLPDLDKFDKKVNHLVILDDMLLEKNLKKVDEYYIRARKLNVSVMFLAQTWFDIDQELRKNVQYVILLRIGGQVDVRNILRAFPCDSKDQLYKMYEYATRDDLSAFIINTTTRDKTKMYRKGFKKFLNPDDFK